MESEEDCEQMIANNKENSAKKMAEICGFVYTWLLEVDWFCLNDDSSSMFCDFCQCAGCQLAVHSEFVNETTKFKKKNIRSLWQYVETNLLAMFG